MLIKGLDFKYAEFERGRVYLIAGIFSKDREFVENSMGLIVKAEAIKNTFIKDSRVKKVKSVLMINTDFTYITGE